MSTQPLTSSRYRAFDANGAAAQRGLYVGTIAADPSGHLSDSLAFRYVWNNYNRMKRAPAASGIAANEAMSP